MDGSDVFIRTIHASYAGPISYLNSVLYAEGSNPQSAEWPRSITSTQGENATPLRVRHGVCTRGPRNYYMVICIRQMTDQGTEGAPFIIGLCGFSDISSTTRNDLPIRTGEVRFVLHPGYAGSQHAADAMRCLLAFGFARADEGGLQLNRIQFRPEGDALLMDVMWRGLGLGLDSRQSRLDPATGSYHHFWEVALDQWVPPHSRFTWMDPAPNYAAARPYRILE